MGRGDVPGDVVACWYGSGEQKFQILRSNVSVRSVVDPCRVDAAIPHGFAVAFCALFHADVCFTP